MFNLKFIKILFHYPTTQINLLKFISYFLLCSTQKNFLTLHLFSYVLITKYINNLNTFNMAYTPFTQNIPTHACSVLVFSRDFLGNLIPTLNIEPHLVVMFLHDYGLSLSPQSLGFHIPILHIKPPSGDGYPTRAP